jgi:hypothetical protein
VQSSHLKELADLSKKLDGFDDRLRSMGGVAGAIFWTCPFPAWLKSPNGAGDNYWVMAAINRAYEKAFNVSIMTYCDKPDYDIWGVEVAAGFRANDIAVRDGGKMVVTDERFPLVGNFGPHRVVKWPVYEANVFRGVAGAVVGPTILDWIDAHATGK